MAAGSTAAAAVGSTAAKRIYAKWVDNRPVRIAIPVEEDFEKAIKLALSLQFAVKLDMNQPDSTLIQQLSALVDDYPHRPTVAQPVEFFIACCARFVARKPSISGKFKAPPPG